MRLVDVVALVMLIFGGLAFGLGEAALSRAEDLRAFYWLTVGIVALRSSVAFLRPGARA
jgi:hypothetical protein